MRRRLLTLLAVVLVAAAVSTAPPASADTVTVPDPQDDVTPDIRSLYAKNATSITVRLRFTELTGADTATERIHFGRAKDVRHWVVDARLQDGTWSAKLRVVRADGSFGPQIFCTMLRFRDPEAQTSSYRFERDCIDDLPSSLRFWAIATGPDTDKTVVSPWVAKG